MIFDQITLTSLISIGYLSSYPLRNTRLIKSSRIDLDLLEKHSVTKDKIISFLSTLQIDEK
jgi:hypothetical protein